MEQIDRPIVLYKSQHEVEVARKEVIKESAEKIKRVTYPLWAVAIFVNSLLLIGYYQQEKLIARNSAKLRIQEHNNANRLRF